ncbi:MAG: NADH-ubiquinone oxidoreductase-F iron-sulfur binding region domain-containing protein [Candidatus Kaelpia imicola]|nr:NADH-ubiquinone oxidoreductase-F iron-sulfur binding region domain-containing protein [Candidatus Kaelpia imicola]
MKREGVIIFSDIKLGEALKKALKIGRLEVLDVVRDSNLKGRGGAGFPTGVKWNLAATSSDNKKYIVTNADEGEPGTFKDRILLTEYPKLLFEGMIIAAYAIGAEKGFLYLRGEYKLLLPKLKRVLKDIRAKNLLGDKILGNKDFSFDIEIRLGFGAYVCGEETALIESLEGHRGEPRNRPPFPVYTGYNGHPTVVNNVETLSNIAPIILKGPEWFKSIGTEASAGSKIISVSGDCKKPGVYEVPFGTSINKILKLVDASDIKAVVVGGASGLCIGKDQFNRRVGFEDLPTGGSIMVFNNKRSLMDVVENFLEFFKDESCGQCTPCREGIPVLIEGVNMIKRGECNESYLKSLLSLSETMQLASKCGLGQSAPNIFVSVINDFKKEYRLSSKKREEIAFNG